MAKTFFTWFYLFIYYFIGFRNGQNSCYLNFLFLFIFIFIYLFIYSIFYFCKNIFLGCNDVTSTGIVSQSCHKSTIKTWWRKRERGSGGEALIEAKDRLIEMLQTLGTYFYCVLWGHVFCFFLFSFGE
jgi:hypothetical protein